MGRTIQVSGFPSSVTSEAVKEFLEIFAGKGTVYALKIRPCKAKGLLLKAFAVVQFTSSDIADRITLLINQRLSYGTNKLKVWNVENDIVPKPRVPLLSLEVLALHFGCQVSKEKFHVLWKCVGAVVKFGFGLRKLEFLLNHSGVEYKFELSYNNIWAVQLRCPQNQHKKFLLIQVLAAPKIYENPQRSMGQIDGFPTLDYFRDGIDDQWVRTTDFTASYCIGQSSAICLELPKNCELPRQIRDNFTYFKEDEGPFFMEKGSSFSHNLDLVPILGPPRGIELPYDIFFKVNLLVQNGCLPGPTIDAAFFDSVNPLLIPKAYIEHALDKMFHLSECCYEPVKWLQEQYNTYRKSKNFRNPSAISLGDGLVYIRRVQVTPSKVYFYGPEVMVSNRVLRHCHEAIDNFIRVSFVDEESEKLRSTDLSPRTSSREEDKKQTAIYRRILSTLRNGIAIGDKKFDLLAFSSSQLRENSAWFFASKDGLTAACIREWMGDFHEIRNVAKYAARLGQSFSSSKETLIVNWDEVDFISDIEIERDGKKYIFSDGIGKTSRAFAQKVARKCGIGHFTPSAFQIRYGGYKGVVAVDPNSVAKLSLRKSMFKYTSYNTGLDVLQWSKPQACFLNRQLITLLSTLGVKDNIFEKKQKEVVDQLDMILIDPIRAIEALELMSPGENANVLREMLTCGYKPNEEPFLSMMLQTFRASKLLELRNRSRIYLPNGRSMMGCLDETRKLEYGQVFVQISRIGSKSYFDHTAFTTKGNLSGQPTSIVEGKVIVAKNPCLHPGDVRILQAVNVPDLHHMVDCVIFPQKGTRPHPNECSGSDLDGDIYFVCWDPELIPPRQKEPMDYTPATNAHLDHDVTIEEVEEYFTNYMLNDSLGVIANAHTAFADKELGMAESPACVELARLFSVAVDFPKTGVPAAIPPNLYVKEYPDFMDKLDKPSYQSQRVIGKLFREVKDMAPKANCIPKFTWEVAKQCYDYDMEYEGFEDYIDDAFNKKGRYDFKLGNLMDLYRIKSEAELIGKSVITTSKSFDRRKDAEAVGLAVKSLRKEARDWFDDKGRRSGSHSSDQYAKASAWYHVTYHPSYWGSYNEGMKRDHFLSFPWCVYDKLIHIKKSSGNRKQMAEDTQCSRFNLGLKLG
ncbi:hypothetical protein Sjap_014754 [Stephania japonica]|uniref:RNA-dependent RNA polymerase n=1 Tax=Stephania japonica TaxID=461633 RepID=A0AAP0NQ94_9MAGN